jgi:hypothetical protein
LKDTMSQENDNDPESLKPWKIVNLINPFLS